MPSQNNNHEKCIANYESCKQCQINYLKENFTFSTSGNEKIDEFIQEKQFNINIYWTVVFEWIPYNRLYDIKETNKDDLAIAIWKDGPLCYDYVNQNGWARELDKKVALKCLHNSQDITNEFLNEIEKINSSKVILSIYGISQNSDTKDYIMVFQYKHCEKCGEYSASEWCTTCQVINSLKNFRTNWTSNGNNKIDDFVQEMRLKINNYNSIVFEWIPYNQFNDIKEIGKGCLATATWKDGSLYYDNENKEYARKSGIKVALKCLQNITTVEEFLNEVKKYSINNKIYGISQNPDTEDYIMVLQFKHCEICGEYGCETCQIIDPLNKITRWTSGNEKIDDFIQQLQFGINYRNILFEWIPYYQFYNINEIGESNFAVAIWKVGPLCYNENQKKWTRKLDEKVALKCFYNSQNIINEFLNEVKKMKFKEILSVYGITQNPDTKDYIMVFEHHHCEECGEQYDQIMFVWCKPCQINYFRKNFKNWTSGNEKIDNLIQSIQLSMNYETDVRFEWIPYNQFYNIKEIGNNRYSAIWKDGPLDYNQARESDDKVALQNININKFIEIIDKKTIDVLKIYGISQNPDTEDYIMVLQFNHCEDCGERYSEPGWCKQCQIDSLKQNFTNWTSGDKRIDDFIQEMQLQIDNYSDIVVEWIPYNQLKDIKEIGQSDFITVYSAIWKNGPCYFNGNSYFNGNNKEYMRRSDMNVVLKGLKNFTEKFLNEEKYSIKNNIYEDNNYIRNTLKLYGISQNPDTKDYIMVLDYAEDKNYKIQCEKCGKQYMNLVFAKEKCCLSCQISYLNINKTSGNEKIDDLIQKIQTKIDYVNDVIFEWIPYSQFKDIKEIGKGGFATVYSAIWKDGPLYYDDISFSSIKYKRQTNKKVGLKCLYNSQNITNEFLNEVKAYSLENSIFKNSIDFDDIIHGDSIKRVEEFILKIYGISQNPDTNDYIMVLDYAEGGNLNDWINKNYINFNWSNKIRTLDNIIKGLNKLHQKKIVHRDFHTGNILIKSIRGYGAYISDMGLCGKVDNMDKSKIYGVMPYVAPEVLQGKPYTQRADIYSFGMIMYFIATGRQPFANYAHDEFLVLNICNGIRPELNELEVPKCYIDLMKQCWDLNPYNRPNAIKISELIELFCDSYMYDVDVGGAYDFEFDNQFKEAEEYRKTNLLSIENNQLTNNHPKAIYISRLLNPFTKDLPKYDNIDNNSVEIIDFTELSVNQRLN